MKIPNLLHSLLFLNEPDFGEYIQHKFPDNFFLLKYLLLFQIMIVVILYEIHIFDFIQSSPEPKSGDDQIPFQEKQTRQNAKHVVYLPPLAPILLFRRP